MNGSVFKRGSSWYYKVTIGKDPQTGKRLQKSKGGFKTKKDCQVALAEIITHVDKGTYVESSEMLIKDYLDYWLDTYCKTNLAPSSYKRYKELCQHVKNHIGMLKISALNTMHVQKFYNDLVCNSTLSNSTIVKVHRVLNLAFKHAVEWKLIPHSPIGYAKPPKASKCEMKIWDEFEVSLFLSKIKDSNIYIPCMLALETGMREGEICALKWDDVDFQNNYIRVNKTLSKIDGEMIIKQPKTQRSNRTIAIMEKTAQELKKLRKLQLEMRLKTGINYEYVCCWLEDGRPYLPNYITKNFIKFINDNNFSKIRFHDLRHTHATLLLKAGVNPKIVSERLGHSSVSITLDIYSHVLPNMQKEAVRQLENLLSNSF